MTCTCNRIVATDADMRAAIRANYDAADPAMVADGIRWYSDAESMIRADADRFGVPFSTAAAVYAACSINASWAANATTARKWLAYAAGQGAQPTGLQPTVERCAQAVEERPATFTDADRILASARGNYAKVRSFNANFHGAAEYVTVDRWALVAAGLASVTVNARGKVTPCNTHGKAPKGAEYDRVADAYRAVAAELGITPRDLQAAVWCAVRGSAN